jgi:hypothetical protein
MITANLSSVELSSQPPWSQLLGLNPCDWWGVDKLCDAAGDAAQSVGTNILGSIATGIAGLALGFLKMIWGLIEGTTRPDSNGEFLYDWAGRLFAISLVITVGFMALQAVTALIRRQGSAGVLRAVWGAGIAILATTISLPVIHAFTTALDAIADDFAAITFGDLDSMIDRYDYWLHADDGEDSQWAQVVGGAFGATAASLGLIFLGWLILLAGFAVWGALLIRSMLLYVFAVTAPIAIMGLVWDKTSRWFTRWVSGLTAIMFTKLGVMVVFGLGVSMLDSLDFGDDTEGAFGVLFSGVLMMAMASLVPVVAFKFFSFLGDETSAAFHHRDAESGAAAGKQAWDSRPKVSSVLARRQSRQQPGPDGASGGPGHGPQASPRGGGPGGGGQGPNGSNGSGGSTTGGAGSGSTGGAAAASGAPSGAAGSAGGASGGAAGAGAAGAGVAAAAAVVAEGNRKAAQIGRSAAHGAGDQASTTSRGPRPTSNEPPPSTHSS